MHEGRRGIALILDRQAGQRLVGQDCLSVTYGKNVRLYLFGELLNDEPLSATLSCPGEIDKLNWIISPGRHINFLLLSSSSSKLGLATSERLWPAASLLSLPGRAGPSFLPRDWL